MATKYTDREIIDGVLEEFAQICSVPHPSGQEKALADLLWERLRAWGLRVQQDAAGNLWADLPTSEGRDGEGITALQAHLDMVPGTGDPAYAPSRDRIETVVQDGWLTTGGRSTLGADCGAGLAVMLWLCRQEGWSHPPLRLVMTVEEEVGLRGAHALDPAALAGVENLINLDGFSADRMIVGSAGGLREHFCRAVRWESAPEGDAWRITVAGLTGGHSGYDIDKGRANANLLMGMLLERLCGGRPAGFCGLTGGTSWNAIAASCTAELVTRAPVEAIVRRFQAEVCTQYAETDPRVIVTARRLPRPAQVWSEADGTALLDFLAGLSNGVLRRQVEGVALSSNLGRVTSDGGQLCLDCMMRSVDAAAEKRLHEARCKAAARCGFTAQVHSRYPAWPVTPGARLTGRLLEAFAQEGRTLRLDAAHVGLEVSVLREKKPDMDCVCLGMHLEDCHSVEERWELGSIPPFVRALLRCLAGEV